MLYYSNWFCHMTFLSAVWLFYTCTFICMCIFTRDWTSWISWCYSFSWSFMKPVNNLFLWIESIFFVDIYLRWWTSIQLILNLKWNYDAQTHSHVLCQFCYCYYFCFIFEQKLQSCDTCVHVNDVLLYVLNYCILFVFFCIVIFLCLQNINTTAELESLCFGNYFSKLKTMCMLLH